MLLMGGFLLGWVAEWFAVEVVASWRGRGRYERGFLVVCQNSPTRLGHRVILVQLLPLGIGHIFFLQGCWVELVLVVVMVMGLVCFG